MEDVNMGFICTLFSSNSRPNILDLGIIPSDGDILSERDAEPAAACSI